MKTTLLTLAVAVALGAVAGCDRNAEQRSPSTATPAPSSPAGTGGTATRQSDTPSTPANIGQGKEHAQPPVQGREDVREPEQRRDFQHKGDGAGPKPGG
ncbi:MAG TPA: hypothetical protein VF280_11810 [Burkholderiales bacterium]|jgi:hypothetical protein